MGKRKRTFDWAIFNSYVTNYQNVHPIHIPFNHYRISLNHYKMPLNHYKIPLNHNKISLSHYNVPLNHYKLPLNHYNIPLNPRYPILLFPFLWLRSTMLRLKLTTCGGYSLGQLCIGISSQPLCGVVCKS